MGVDPKRPLVGFALVAVLCAVLMTLSVGRGWGLDLFHAGKPIAVSAAGGHLDRTPVTLAPSAGPARVRIPAELSAQPLGVVNAGPVPVTDAVRSTEADTDVVTVNEPVAPETPMLAQVDKQADRKAERTADRVQRRVDRAADTSARSAEKAAERAVRSAQKAADHAARDAAKAQRRAERMAAKLVREAQKAAKDAAKDAEKAAKDTEKAARKG